MPVPNFLADFNVATNFLFKITCYIFWWCLSNPVTVRKFSNHASNLRMTWDGMSAWKDLLRTILKTLENVKTFKELPSIVAMHSSQLKGCLRSIRDRR